jgi:hypothetical protein
MSQGALWEQETVVCSLCPSAAPLMLRSMGNIHIGG